MTNATHVDGGRLQTVLLQDEYQAFDALPYQVRHALRYAYFKYSAMDCLWALNTGMPERAVVSIIADKDRRLVGETGHGR